jgi:hypothetical protein
LRYRAWLLVAILAFTANFGVARVAPRRAPSSIECVLESAAVEEHSAEAQATLERTWLPLLVAAPSDTFHSTAGHDPRLFQRPPPSLFFLS